MDAVEKAKVRPSRPAHGRRRHRDGAVHPLPEIRSADPDWPDRDRFVLSAGHGSMLLYAAAAPHRRKGMTIERAEELPPARLEDRRPPRELRHAPGVETTTGPLGQGIATAVGMALAERMLAARFGDDLVDHYTYVLASDGDLMEGISQEAIALAGHLKLNKLIVLFDDNGISIDGRSRCPDSTDQVKRFEASGWRAMRVDGHDPDAIAAAIAGRKKSDRPTLIACKTTIGFGAPNQGRHLQGARRAARRRGDRGREEGARLDARALRRPRRHQEGLGARRAARRSARKAWESKRLARSAPRSGRVRARACRRSCPPAGTAIAELQGEARRRQAQGRHPQGERDGAGG
jgi:transketolase